jgi:hypothetical protein
MDVFKELRNPFICDPSGVRRLADYFQLQIARRVLHNGKIIFMFSSGAGSLGQPLSQVMKHNVGIWHT